MAGLCALCSVPCACISPLHLDPFAGGRLMVAASIPLCSAASPPAVAAHSSFLRGVIGLLIGIPIIVFG
jgi:hypothetical protein